MATVKQRGRPKRTGPEQKAVTLWLDLPLVEAIDVWARHLRHTRAGLLKTILEWSVERWTAEGTEESEESAESEETA